MANTSFEAKFGQLADTQIHDKVPVLSDYKIGFQVIDKEDDETRAVGIMAYKAGKQWIYVPCFWLNGRLKCQDLMYLKQQDMFLPLDEGWVNYIKSQSPIVVGMGTDNKSMKDKAKPEAISMRPLSTFGVTKYASEYMWMDSDTLDNMLVQPSNMADLSLSTWLPRMGKEASLDLLATMNQHRGFASALMTFYSPDEMQKIAEAVEKADKDNTQEAKTKVEIITDPATEEAQNLPDTAKNILMRDGVFIVDNRTDTSDVFSEEVDTHTLETPKQTGIYDVLMFDGSYKRMLVIIPSRQLVRTSDASHEKGEAFLCSTDSNKKEVACVDSSSIHCRPAVADGDTKLPEFKSFGTPIDNDFLGEGGPCVVMDKQGCTISGNMTAGKDGPAFRAYATTAKGINKSMSVVPTHREGTIIIGRDTVYLPEDCKGFRIIGKRQSDLSELGSVNTALFKIASEGGTDLERIKIFNDGKRYHITDNTDTHGHLNKVAALTRLMNDYTIHAPSAKMMLKEAEEKQTARYMVKLAYSDFDQAIDENDERGNDITYNSSVHKPTPLDSGAVNQVSQAAQMGIKDVMDTTVLKTLAKRKNTMGMLSDYMPDLVKAVDRLGRLLFLFYWHNDDFQDRYGKQKMYDLEQSLRDVFTSLSDTVVFLKERTTEEGMVMNEDSDDLGDDMGT